MVTNTKATQKAKVMACGLLVVIWRVGEIALTTVERWQMLLKNKNKNDMLSTNIIYNMKMKEMTTWISIQ